MKRVQEYLKIAYNAHKRDWDTVICITGENRKGKTNLGLHMVEEWLKLQGIEVTPNHVDKHIGISKVSFARVLEGAKKMDPIMDDEAGDISSRSAMSKANRLYMTGYQVVAAENLFTILILPEFWNLDSYFRKDRVKHLFHVYARGKVAFWDKDKLKRLVAVNETMKVKNLLVEYPTFYDTFPKYNGPLKERYEALKLAKMKQVRKELLKEIEEDAKMGGRNVSSQMQIRNAAIRKMVKDGMTDKAIAEELFLQPDTIKKYRREMRMQKIAGEGE